MDAVVQSQVQGQGLPFQNIPYQSTVCYYGESIVSLTNPEQELIQMAQRLRNQFTDASGNVISTGEALLNEIGINSIMGQVESIVSRGTVMSNLEGVDVINLLDFLADTLALDLMLNRIKYDIRNAATRSRIYFIALSSAYICMRRSYDQGERRFLKGADQTITYRQEGQAYNQPQGILSKAMSMMGWGKR